MCSRRRVLGTNFTWQQLLHPNVHGPLTASPVGFRGTWLRLSTSRGAFSTGSMFLGNRRALQPRGRYDARTPRA